MILRCTPSSVSLPGATPNSPHFPHPVSPSSHTPPPPTQQTRGNNGPVTTEPRACGGDNAYARAPHQCRGFKPTTTRQRRSGFRSTSCRHSQSFLCTPCTRSCAVRQSRDAAREESEVAQNSARWQHGHSHAIFQRPAGWPRTRVLGRMRDNIAMLVIRPLVTVVLLSEGA